MTRSETAYHSLKLILFAVAIAAIASLVVLELQCSRLVEHLDANQQAVAGEIVATAETLNRPCGAGHPCGTLAEAGKLMAKGGDVLTTTQLNENKETVLLDGELTPLLAHADRSLSNLDDATAELHPLMTSATARIDGLAAIEENTARLVGDLDGESSATLSHFNDTLSDVHELMANPDIPRLMHHAADATGSLDSMLFTFNAVETKATKNYLHPSGNPFVRTWQTAKPFLVPGAQIAGALAVK